MPLSSMILFCQIDSYLELGNFGVHSVCRGPDVIFRIFSDNVIYELGIRISLFIVYKIKMVTLPTLSSFDFLHSQWKHTSEWISQQFLIINKTTPRPARKASPGCTVVYSSHQKDPRDRRFLSICGNFQSFLSLFPLINTLPAYSEIHWRSNN